MDFLLEKSWLLYILAGLAGYLVGSISVFRIIHRFLKKRYQDGTTDSVESGRDITAEPPVYSASVLGTDYGKKFGCITSVLDMLKVALPTLAVRLLFPDQDYYLVTALLAITGNSYPLYHKFKGGAGYSAILGAVFVINWFGVFIAHAAAMVLGYLFGSIGIMRLAGNILYIIGAIVLVVVICVAYSKTKGGHLMFSKLALSLPLFGKVFSQAFIVVFCRTTATLLASGVSVLEAFNILSGMTDNDVINLVNLKFLAEKHQCSPEKIVRMKKQGKSFANMHGEFKKAKAAKKQKPATAKKASDKKGKGRK